MKYSIILFTRCLGCILACCIPSTIQAASVSDLLISEIMANPAAVSDGNGEWFELFNPTSEAINLNGIKLFDDGSNEHIITSSSSLIINSGSYFVLARNDNSLINGDFIADYVYGSDFALTNTSDEIVLSDSDNNTLRLNYTSGFVSNGASMELTSDTMLLSNYIASTSAYGVGDFGTPGSTGSYNFAVAPSPVPLPGAAWLMVSGLIGLLSFKRKSQLQVKY